MINIRKLWVVITCTILLVAGIITYPIFERQLTIRAVRQLETKLSDFDTMDVGRGVTCGGIDLYLAEYINDSDFDLLGESLPPLRQTTKKGLDEILNLSLRRSSDTYAKHSLTFSLYSIETLDLISSDVYQTAIIQYGQRHLLVFVNGELFSLDKNIVISLLDYLLELPSLGESMKSLFGVK